MARLEGEVDLFRVKGAELYLVDEKETILIQKGDMAVVFSQRPRCPTLAVVVALVGDLHWPIARDSPAISLGNGHYAFSLPGSILYGLALPTSVELPQQILALDDILRHYSTFEIHSLILPDRCPWAGDIGGGNVNEGNTTTRANCNTWASLAPMIEQEVASLVERKKIPSSSTLNLQILKAKSKSKSKWSNIGVMSCQVLKRTQGARQMSAVVKLISKMVVVGGIDIALHVHPHINLHGDGHVTEVAIASVNAFSDFLEAMESGGRSLFNLRHKSSNSSSSSSSVGLHTQLEGNINWTLNKEGLKKLLWVTSTSLKYWNNTSTQSISSPYASQLPSSSPYQHDTHP